MSQRPSNRPATRPPQRRSDEPAVPPSRPRPSQRPGAPPPDRYAARAPQRTYRRPPPPPQRGISQPVLIGIGGAVILILVLGILLLMQRTPSSGASAVGTVPTVPSVAGNGAGDVAATMAPAVVSTPGQVVTVNPATVPGTPIAGLIAVSGLDRGHTKDKVNYPQIPPLGGQHWDKWQNCGVYAEPVVNEQAVHSLEHGAIWITYQPSLPADQIEALRKITRQSSYRLLSPYPGLPHPIVASAWGYQVALEKPDDPRLSAFIANFEKNPNGPEPGASCSNSEGNPLP